MLRVLMFHRVADRASAPLLNPGLISASPEVFERIARRLARRYYVIDMEQALAAVLSGRLLPSRAVLLTFDDAYRDFAEAAWPVLRASKLPATLFVPTGFATDAGREFWWDRLYRALVSAPVPRLHDTPIGPIVFDTPERLASCRRRLQAHVKALPHDEAMALIDTLCERLHCPAPPSRSVLTWPELRQLASDGVTLAPHTRTHPLLTRVPADVMRAEIAGSRDDLIRELGHCVRAFAYPAGAVDERVRAIVRDEGFSVAFTTLGGHNRLPCRDVLLLRRTNVSPRTPDALLAVRLSRWGEIAERWRHRGTFAGAPAEVQPPAPPTPGRGPVAYVMSRFPKLTETFVLNEMLAVERLGAQVAVYPLLRQRQRVVHDEVSALAGRVHVQALVSPAVVRANIEAILQQPRAYASVWREVLRGTWGSANFFFGAIGILPKAVWMARDMRRSGIAHVHAHFANHPAVAALVVHRLSGIPFSFTAHGSDLHVERRMLDGKVAAAAFVVAISRLNREIILDACGGRHAEKVHVVHCGVDPEWFAGAAVPPVRDRFEFVCVASFEPVKGHAHLLRACALLQARGVRFSCRLVGDGPLRGQIVRQIAGSGLAGIVTLHGACTRAQVAGLLRRCDGAVLASAPTASGKREGIPVALMEAMSAGLPVVATTSGGIPELVEHERSGLLVPPANPGALADAVERLARDAALRRRLGTAARLRVQRHFSQQACAAEVLSLIRSGRLTAIETGVPCV